MSPVLTHAPVQLRDARVGRPCRQLSIVSGFRDFHERARRRGEAELLPRCTLPAVPSWAADKGGRHFGCDCLSCPVLSMTWLGWEWPVYHPNPAVQPSSGTEAPLPCPLPSVLGQGLGRGPLGLCSALSGQEADCPLCRPRVSGNFQ